MSRAEVVSPAPDRPRPGLPVIPPEIPRDELKLGALLAQGGEGQVYQLPRTPHLVYKCYRHPRLRRYLDDLVAWPAAAGPTAAGLARSATAWPCSVVTGPGGEGVGLLMPRAPRRFAQRHRDGLSRLASLSYLTADPGHREAAYGIKLPPPASVERLGLVCALARLLAAFESAQPAVSHGDLSTKNVLWSLQRGPEIFVIDCDNSLLSGAETADPGGSDAGRSGGANAGLADAAQVGDRLSNDGRRRAMTPNWGDPAVPSGQDPIPESDRYSLALIFLRIVGAANFPIQAHQRAGGPIEVDFPVPPGPAAAALLDPEAPVWDLCRRGLMLSDPTRRPNAAAWVGPLEQVLDAAGGTTPMRSVPTTSRPAAAQTASGRPGPAEVTIRPVKVSGRPDRAWSRVSPIPPYRGAAVAAAATAAATAAGNAPTPGHPGPGAGLAARTPRADPLSAPVWPRVKTGLRWWMDLHRTMLRLLVTPGRRIRATQQLALCGLIDFVALVGVGAIAALIASPLVQS